MIATEARICLPVDRAVRRDLVGRISGLVAPNAVFVLGDSRRIDRRVRSRSKLYGHQQGERGGPPPNWGVHGRTPSPPLLPAAAHTLGEKTRHLASSRSR